MKKVEETYMKGQYYHVPDNEHDIVRLKFDEKGEAADNTDALHGIEVRPTKDRQGFANSFAFLWCVVCDANSTWVI
jgi:hypothetical protein